MKKEVWGDEEEKRGMREKNSAVLFGIHWEDGRGVPD